METPKIIHYCWFGLKPIPAVEQKCIESWQKYLPDYELMFWNEKTFDIHSNTFAKQAYEAKHYAFVSDYVRTKVLYDYGGLYLDTDVQLLEGFQKFILNERNCFTAFHTRAQLGAGVMAFVPNHPLIKEILLFYQRNNFKDSRGNINTIANVSMITDIFREKGMQLGGRQQEVLDVTVYAREYFYPKKISDTEFVITPLTVAVHIGSCSWMTEREKRRGNNKIWINVMRPLLRSIKGFGLKIIGAKRVQKLEIFIRNILK